MRKSRDPHILPWGTPLSPSYYLHLSIDSHYSPLKSFHQVILNEIQLSVPYSTALQLGDKPCMIHTVKGFAEVNEQTQCDITFFQSIFLANSKKVVSIPFPLLKSFCLLAMTLNFLNKWTSLVDKTISKILVNELRRLKGTIFSQRIGISLIMKWFHNCLLE